MKRLRIGTRGSALALWQANYFREALLETCGLESEIVVIKTSGDQNAAMPPQQIGVIGIFTKELEDSLLDGRADLAVHSMKDVPTEFSEHCRIATVFKREDPRDALVSAQLGYLKIRPERSQLRRAPQTAGANARAVWQSRERLATNRNQRIARIFALENRGDPANAGKLRRHIFHAVHGQVRAPIQQRIFQLLRENSDHADLLRRHGHILIARRFDHHNLRVQAACLLQRVAKVIGLPQRQRAAARPNAQRLHFFPASSPNK